MRTHESSFWNGFLTVLVFFRFSLFMVLFIVQDADQVERLNESGELRQLLKSYKVGVVHVIQVYMDLADLVQTLCRHRLASAN